MSDEAHKRRKLPESRLYLNFELCLLLDKEQLVVGPDFHEAWDELVRLLEVDGAILETANQILKSAQNIGPASSVAMCHLKNVKIVGFGVDLKITLHKQPTFG